MSKSNVGRGAVMDVPFEMTPRERWGTCCPFDPECDHSYLDTDDLARWMDTPISDAQADEVAS